MAEVGKLVVRIAADVSGLKGDLAKATREVEGVSASINRQAAMVSGAFKALVAGGVGIALNQMFELGSAVEETSSKFRTVMGPAIDDANAFLDDFATQAGLSRRAAEDLTATTAAIAQGMGFAQTASAGFAEEVIRLSADIGSFNNQPTEDVVRRITAALAGERESLKQLGIVINEADVQQRALNDTGKASASLLTQQEKATATLALVTEKAGVAIGDLARTQDSAANTARRVTARMADLRAEIATAALPVFAELIGALDDSAGGFDFLRDSIRGVGTFIRTAIAEVQILGTRLAELAALGDIVGNAFATKANKRPFAEVLEDFRRIREAAGETREEILQSLNAAVSQGDATEGTVRAQTQLTAAAVATTKQIEAAAKAESERLAAIVELIELRAEEEGELELVVDRLAEINRLQERGIADARERLDILKEETRLRGALVGRIGTPSGGIATPGQGFTGGSSPLTANFNNLPGVKKVRAALAELDAQAKETAESTDGLGASLLAGVEGIAALDRAAGFLPTSLRGAVSGIADAVRGFQTAQTAGASAAQQIAGGAGIVGGIISIGVGLLNASDEAREKAQQAREQLQASIRDFVSPLQGFQGDINRAAEELDKIAGGTAFRANFARTLGSATEALDFLAREAARLSDTRAGEVVQALANRLNQARESFAGELELRRVAAEFGKEAADRLRTQIELEKALAEARRLGIDEAVVREAFAAEERRRLREEQARAEEELARAQQEAARAAEEAARAQEEAARIAAETAARIEEGNQALRDEIALRELLLDGKDDEAELLRREIRFRQELQEAIEAGLDQSLIDRLRELQDRERQRTEDQEAIETVIRQSQRAAVSEQRSDIRASVASISALQADSLTELARSRNSLLRDISLGIQQLNAGGGVGGSRTTNNLTFAGPITLDASFLRSAGGSRFLDGINRGLGSQQQDDALLTSGGVLR